MVVTCLIIFRRLPVRRHVIIIALQLHNAMLLMVMYVHITWRNMCFLRFFIFLIQAVPVRFDPVQLISVYRRTRITSRTSKCRKYRK